MSKTINLIGVVGWDIDQEEFSNEIDNTTGDIEFEIGSGGGYVADGVFILNKIRAYDRGKTTAKISYAASMMTQIALACDTVEVYDNAIFMIHNVQNIVVGDHNDMREAAELQERMSDSLANLYVQKTGKTLTEIKQMMDNDTYLFGQEIVDAGFADNVITTEENKNKDEMIALAKVKIQQTVKANKQENLSLEDLKNQFQACVGGCNMGGDNSAVPTAAKSDKLAPNSNTGEGMEVNEEDFKLLEEQNKVFRANRETLLARNETLEEQLRNANAALEAKELELQAVVDKQNEQIAGISTTAIARVKEAFATGVASQETILAMMAEADDTKASQIALNAKPSDEALHINEGNAKKISSLSAYANKHKGSIQ